MKKIIAFVCLLALYCSCYKANDEVDASHQRFDITYNMTNSNNHAVGGNINDSTINISVGDSTRLEMRFKFSLISGDPTNYPIKFYLGNLPGRTITSRDTNIFKLNCDLFISINIDTDTGNYTIYANVNTPDGTSAYPLHVHVVPLPAPPDCAPVTAATYNCRGNYTDRLTGMVFLDSCTIVVSTIPGQPYQVNINNIRGLGDSINITGTAGCDGYIRIPLQTTHGYTIYGMGGYGEDIHHHTSMQIRDTIIYGADTQTCVGYLTQ